MNTKPLKFKCGLADGGGGVAGWWTRARHGYPHPVYNDLGYPDYKSKIASGPD